MSSLGRFGLTSSGRKLRATAPGSNFQGRFISGSSELLEKPGEVVTRRELRVRLWPADTHVTYDANVNTTVNKLRRRLAIPPISRSTSRPFLERLLPPSAAGVSDKPLIRSSPQSETIC